MSKSKTNPGKKFRAGVNKASRDRNWTNLETDAYASILADGESNYALTLETKALKKKSNKKVFEAILVNFNVARLPYDHYTDNFVEGCDTQGFRNAKHPLLLESRMHEPVGRGLILVGDAAQSDVAQN